MKQLDDYTKQYETIKTANKKYTEQLLQTLKIDLYTYLTTLAQTTVNWLHKLQYHKMQPQFVCLKQQCWSRANEETIPLIIDSEREQYNITRDTV